jgi:hypothetical protein
VSEKYANRKKAKAHVHHQAKVVPTDLRPRAIKKRPTLKIPVSENLSTFKRKKCKERKARKHR